MDIRLLLAGCLCLALGACGSTVKENHYFAAYSPHSPDEPVEFYRLTVTANSVLSNSRFVAGYYDERAVDLLFDEVRAGGEVTGEACDCALEPLFSRGFTGTNIQPLAPTAQNGAFVMILSTNADAVASTIGSFAESQILADAISNLVFRDELEAASEQAVRSPVRQASAGAGAAIIDGALRRAAEADDAGAATQEYLRALNTIARSLGRPTPFEDFDKARYWFEREYDHSAGLGE